MQDQPGSMPRSPTLDDLAALNREIAALVRAGLPLEAGLRQIAADDARGPGQLAARLAHETSAGKSLAEAIAVQGDALPPVYRTVVEAGLKAGRLPAALEGFADSAARTAELRRITAQAAVYPAIVFVLAWSMLLWLGFKTIPNYRGFGIDDQIWAMPLVFSPRVAGLLADGLIVLVLIVAAAWWTRSGSARSAAEYVGGGNLIPGARKAAQLCGQATFADLLGLMVAHGVPLGEALPLAARAGGSKAVRDAADAAAARLSAGQAIDSSGEITRGMPPLVRVALLGSTSRDGLVEGLTHAARVYRDRAATWASNLAVLIPIAATMAVGVFVVGVYALLMLQPYIATLKEAATWSP